MKDLADHTMFIAVNSTTDQAASRRQELKQAVKFLTQLHHDCEGRPPTSEELIALLRERSQGHLADELERLVEQVRAERERKARRRLSGGSSPSR